MCILKLLLLPQEIYTSVPKFKWHVVQRQLKQRAKPREFCGSFAGHRKVTSTDVVLPQRCVLA